MTSRAPVLRVVRGTGDNYTRRRIVVSAENGVRAGDALMGEWPEVAVATVGDVSGRGTWWTCDFCAWQEAYLHTPRDAAESNILLMLECVLRRTPRLVREPAWMDAYIADSPVQSEAAAAEAESVAVVDRLITAYMLGAEHRAAMLRMLGVFRSNAFNCNSPLSRLPYGTAFYRGASYFNHSCAPNAVWFMGEAQRIHVRALCDIARGEEVCISYFDNLHTSGPTVLPALSLGFPCRCVQCVAMPLAPSLTVASHGDEMRAHLRRFAVPQPVYATFVALFSVHSAPLADVNVLMECAQLLRCVTQHPVPLLDVVTLKALWWHRLRAPRAPYTQEEYLFRGLYRAFFTHTLVDDSRRATSTRACMAFVEALSASDCAASAPAIGALLCTNERGALRVLQQEMQIFFMPAAAVPRAL